MIENSTPIINKDFITETFENEILLYTASDTKAVYLNETAHLVWQLCEDQKTVEEMIALLESSYPEQSHVIRKQVIDALNTLTKIGAISFADNK